MATGPKSKTILPGGRAQFCLMAIVTLSVIASPHGGRPCLIWNLTRSAPLGLYLAKPHRDVRVGDWVIARLPAEVAALAVQRRYIGPNVPVLKHVEAGEGDRVCALGARLDINGRLLAYRASLDGHGRPLIRWSGCYRLGPGRFFLLNRDAVNSFDSRYFGPITRAQIITTVRPVWTWR